MLSGVWNPVMCFIICLAITLDLAFLREQTNLFFNILRNKQLNALLNFTYCTCKK